MSKPMDTIDNLSEYIYIDTVSINFILRTKGDFITHDLDPIPFHPNMSDVDRFTNNSQILFPSFIKISQGDVNNRSKIGASRTELFTHLELYGKFIKYVLEEHATPSTKTGLLVIDKDNNDSGNFKSIMVSSEYLTNDQIIINNIGVLKNVFFPINGKIFMLGHKFIIAESKYISHEASEEVYDYINKKFKLPKSYTVIIELNVLDATNNENIGNFMERTCIAKKKSILKDIDDIFSINSESKITIPINTLKTVMTLNRNFGKLITEWEQRNIYIQPPKTEREKMDFEIKMTPFMRNKKDYNEKMIVINSLPPGYVRELNKLDEDFLSFTKKSDNISNFNISNNTKYNTRLLEILFDDITKKYNVGTLLNIIDKDLFTSNGNAATRNEYIIKFKNAIEKYIYEKYKPSKISYKSSDDDETSKLELRLASSEDEAEIKEIISKIEKLKLKNNTPDDTRNQSKWEGIVRSVNNIKKIVKINENKDKLELIKRDNKQNVDEIETKIKEIYVKLQILNSMRKSTNGNDIKWPYFIPHIYKGEKTWEDSEINDTLDELIGELTGYYKNYIKLQNSLNNKRLSGSISILKLQLKVMKEMVSNTEKIQSKLKDDKYRIERGARTTKELESLLRNDEKYKKNLNDIIDVEKIYKNQYNLQQALEEVISKLSESNTSRINNKDGEYIPSNDDGMVIESIKQNITHKRAPLVNLKNINLSIDENNILFNLLMENTQTGGSRLSRKKKYFISRKHNINKKKHNNITKKRNIKRVKFNLI